MKLAYLTSEYPRFSTTFIDREIEALEKQGIQVFPYSLHRNFPNPAASEVQKRLAAKTIVLRRLGAQLADLVRISLSSPRRALSLLIFSQRYFSGIRGFLRGVIFSLDAMRLARSLQRRNIRHLHVHIANSAGYIAFFMNHFDPSLSYSVTLHGPGDFLDMTGQNIASKIRSAQFIRVISQYGREQLKSILSANELDKVHVIRSGINIDDFSFAPKASPGSPLRLLFVGRLSAEKNPEMLLQLGAELQRRKQAFSVTLVGDGPLRYHLEERSRELTILSHVSFVGLRRPEEVALHLQESDILVLPSRAEGIPTVLMEAMAKGTPVLSSRVMGIPELVHDMETGFLLEEISVEGLLRALSRLENLTPSQRADMLTRARRTIEVEYSVDSTVHRLATLLRPNLTETASEN